MARPERVEYEGAYYHVMNRGRGRQSIFPGEKYYKYFLQCLEQAHKRFAVEIHAYCLMGNHSGVTKSISRLTHRMVDDDKLKGMYDVLCLDLTP